MILYVEVVILGVWWRRGGYSTQLPKLECIQLPSSEGSRLSYMNCWDFVIIDSVYWSINCPDTK